MSKAWPDPSGEHMNAYSNPFTKLRQQQKQISVIYFLSPWSYTCIHRTSLIRSPKLRQSAREQSKAVQWEEVSPFEPAIKSLQTETIIIWSEFQKWREKYCRTKFEQKISSKELNYGHQRDSSTKLTTREKSRQVKKL